MDALCTALPCFLWEGDPEHDTAKDQAVYVCMGVRIHLRSSLGLRGTGAASGFTRTDPNPAGLELAAPERGWTRLTPRGGRWMSLQPASKSSVLAANPVTWTHRYSGEVRAGLSANSLYLMTFPRHFALTEEIR